jgi:hypothetical protein
MQRDRVSFFAIGGVLMDPDGRRVDHLDVTIVSL